MSLRQKTRQYEVECIIFYIRSPQSVPIYFSIYEHFMYRGLKGRQMVENEGMRERERGYDMEQTSLLDMTQKHCGSWSGP